ncbi:hypothetical protein, variant [Verruconis gallopava]|nr:hypothetical protein, variant [Verruconis gallopava]KIV99342.1 hypothetical protein, variant [Verruconis gallopava]
MSVVLSPKFNLTNTYFMVAGIAGINPEVATICSVTFAKYAVQVALQYEIDIRELPANYTTGYVPFGVDKPDEYPTSIYGTEVFELNEALQDYAYQVASKVALNDSDEAIAYRANYASADIYAAGAAPPGVYKCDVATSDVYYSGRLLGEAFGNTTKLFTNGSGVYCSTAQEDNATLEVLVRTAAAGLVDFARVLVMRTASDFDREYPGESAAFNLFYSTQGSFLPAIKNLYLAGLPIVQGIISEWDSVFKAGLPAPNYIGDIFGTLGGKPDFGPADFDVTPSKKREVEQPKSRLEMLRRRGPKAGPAVTA